MMVWHYTCDQQFTQIRESGTIRPADEGIPAHERPIVWFSKEQFWEPTVVKAKRAADGSVRQLGMDGLIENQILLIRIGVDPETVPHTWCELKALSGMDSHIARALVKSAKQLGANPSKWRGTFEVVGRDKWRTVEYFNPGAAEWTSLPTDAWRASGSANEAH